MSNELTIAWMTSRKDACFDWFCDSLHRECAGEYSGIQVMAIDYWAAPWFDRSTASLIAQADVDSLHAHEDRRSYIVNCLRAPMERFSWAAPKPCPWQGRYRQTREDWFAAANARNTALALCKTDWICYVDDLSCLVPGWLEAVYNSMRLDDTVTCGAYRKVRDLTVVNGEIVKFSPNLVDDGKGGKCDAGLDNRMKNARNDDPIAAQGNWMFGCSVVAPVKAFLSVNGWDERCDGMGSEDYCTGIAMQKRGWKFRYVPKMLTYESEERHHTEPSFKRSDYGTSPDDKSHAMLRLAQNGNGWIPNNFGIGDLARLRNRTAEGQPFPSPPRNAPEWYTGKLLCEL
jgi:hypothetical protein